MDIKDFINILAFIEKNNSWKNTLYRPDGDFSKPLIKYVRYNLDTRDMKIFNIILDNVSFKFCDTDDFKEEIIKYLNDKNYKSKYMTIIKR